jgi:hypothetical protein
MVVLRAALDPRATFADLVRGVSAAVLGAFAHQELPYQMLPLDTLRAESARPDAVVFQMFAGPMRRAAAGGVAFEPVLDVPEGIGSRWEFELSLTPAEDGLGVLLCYADEVYDRDWARAFAAGYASLAAAVAREPEAPLSSLLAA